MPELDGPKGACLEEERPGVATFTPYDCSATARMARRPGAGSRLTDFFQSLENLRATAYGKEDWWRQGF